MSWNALIDEEALAVLLPEEYARFARPVKEGLVVFLSGLPGDIQQSILADQASLPATASVSKRLGLLALRCPVLHKLAQVLARDQRLAEELRRELRPLESLPPTVDLETIQRVLTEELGPLDGRGLSLNGPPIAEASVAVVVPFQTADGSLPRDGVFKVLKAGIEERLEFELDLLGCVGSHLDERCAELSIPQLDYRDTFEQVRELLLSEIRLDREQRHLLEAAALYKDDRDVQIPALLDHCTSRVTAMERVYGEKVTDGWINAQEDDTQEDRHRLAGIVAHALLTEPMFSPRNRAMFHGDPHAGNLFYTRDGRLAILDWSLVGHLDEPERVAMGQILLGAITFDAQRIVAVLEQLDTRRQVHRSALREVVDGWLGRMRRGLFPGLTWLVGLLDDATQSCRLRLTADMILFRKSLLTINGVLTDLGADGFRLDDEFLREGVLAFGRDWPLRWISLPSSRAFATRLSNWDLATTTANWPLAVIRFWQSEWIDLLRENKLTVSCEEK